MKAPDIIYLQTCGDCCNYKLCPKECEECKFDDLAEVSWCEDKIFDTDREYISKENLMEWLDKKYAEVRQLCNDTDDPVYWGQRNMMLQVIEHLKKMGGEE